jgi:hypothetical protein
MVNFGGRVSLPIELQIENCSMKRYDLWFDSADYRDSFQGSVDGTVVKVDYDVCPTGETDMQRWFQR